MVKANDNANLINDLKSSSDAPSFNHQQFVDDRPIFCALEEDQVENVEAPFWFLKQFQA